MTTVSFADLNTTDRDILFRQWVSGPLSVQTIVAQSITLQMRGSELSLTNNLFLTWVVKLMSNDGLTERGILVAIRRDGTELDTALVNRGDVATSISITSIDGDRLVFEIGVGGLPLISHDSSLRIGDVDAADLPRDDTAIADNNPWIEFQQFLLFAAVAVTTRNTRSNPLGVAVGMGWRMPTTA